ncbi:pentapeptide repeat-containing protein, partial [Limnospira fusiformis KN01]|uniref:pentapeptide repeat-containing protein n=1 Tax=Limnospira fusiformis TaxID=54297 RepID=UPI001658BD9C
LQSRILRDAREFNKTAAQEVALSELATEFIKASQTEKWRKRFKSLGIFGVVPTLLILIPVHFWIINRGREVLFTETDCKPSPDAMFLIKYMIRTGYGRELRGANLCNQALGNIDFYQVNLSQANFRNSRLTGANFRQSILKETDFKKAFLLGADFQRAYLSNANFQEADLTNTDFSEANLQYANLQGADLRNANLVGANFFETNLINTVLLDANLENALSLQVEQIRQAKLCRTTLPSYIDIQSVNPNKDCST